MSCDNETTTSQLHILLTSLGYALNLCTGWTGGVPSYVNKVKRLGCTEATTLPMWSSQMNVAFNSCTSQQPQSYFTSVCGEGA